MAGSLLGTVFLGTAQLGSVGASAQPITSQQSARIASAESWYTPAVAGGNIRVAPQPIPSTEVWRTPSANFTRISQQSVRMATSESWWQPTATPGVTRTQAQPIPMTEYWYAPLTLRNGAVGSIVTSVIPNTEVWNSPSQTSTLVVTAQPIGTQEFWYGVSTRIVWRTAAAALGTAEAWYQPATRTNTSLPQPILSREYWLVPFTNVKRQSAVSTIPSAETWPAARTVRNVGHQIAAIASAELWQRPSGTGGLLTVAPAPIPSTAQWFAPVTAFGPLYSTPDRINDSDLWRNPVVVVTLFSTAVQLLTSDEQWYRPHTYDIGVISGITQPPAPVELVDNPFALDLPATGVGPDRDSTVQPLDMSGRFPAIFGVELRQVQKFYLVRREAGNEDYITFEVAANSQSVALCVRGNTVTCPAITDVDGQVESYTIREVGAIRESNLPFITVRAEAPHYDLGFVPAYDMSYDALDAHSVMDLMLKESAPNWLAGIAGDGAIGSFKMNRKSVLQGLLDIQQIYGGQLIFHEMRRVVDLKQDSPKSSGVVFSWQYNLLDTKRVETDKPQTQVIVFESANGAINGATAAKYLQQVDRIAAKDLDPCETTTIRGIRNTDLTSYKMAIDYAVETLLLQQLPQVTYEATVIDISLLPKASVPVWYDSVHVGDWVTIVDAELNVNDSVRVTEEQYDVLEPWNSTYSFGNTAYVFTDITPSLPERPSAPVPNCASKALGVAAPQPVPQLLSEAMNGTPPTTPTKTSAGDCAARALPVLQGVEGHVANAQQAVQAAQTCSESASQSWGGLCGDDGGVQAGTDEPQCSDPCSNEVQGVPAGSSGSPGGPCDTSGITNVKTLTTAQQQNYQQAIGTIQNLTRLVNDVQGYSDGVDKAIAQQSLADGFQQLSALRQAAGDFGAQTDIFNSQATTAMSLSQVLDSALSETNGQLCAAAMNVKNNNNTRVKPSKKQSQLQTATGLKAQTATIGANSKMATLAQPGISTAASQLSGISSCISAAADNAGAALADGLSVAPTAIPDYQGIGEDAAASTGGDAPPGGSAPGGDASTNAQTDCGQETQNLVTAINASLDNFTQYLSSAKQNIDGITQIISQISTLAGVAPPTWTVDLDSSVGGAQVLHSDTQILLDMVMAAQTEFISKTESATLMHSDPADASNGTAIQAGVQNYISQQPLALDGTIGVKAELVLIDKAKIDQSFNTAAQTVASIIEQARTITLSFNSLALDTSVLTQIADEVLPIPGLFTTITVAFGAATQELNKLEGLLHSSMLSIDCIRNAINATVVGILASDGINALANQAPLIDTPSTQKNPYVNGTWDAGDGKPHNANKGRKFSGDNTGRQRISVMDKAPADPNVWDVWIDTSQVIPDPATGTGSGTSGSGGLS